MLSVVRYTMARCSLSQLWVPPWLGYLLVVGVTYPPDTPAIGSLSIGAIVLVPISAWMCIATLNSESEAQRASIGAMVGGVAKYRLLELLATLLATFALIPFSIFYAILHNVGQLSGEGVTVAVLAHLISAITGTTVGAFVARPVVTRVGFTVVWTVLVTVALVAIPHLPPVRLLVELLGLQHLTAEEMLISSSTPVATIVGAAVLWWLSARISLRRS